MISFCFFQWFGTRGSRKPRRCRTLTMMVGNTCCAWRLGKLPPLSCCHQVTSLNAARRLRWCPSDWQGCERWFGAGMGRVGYVYLVDTWWCTFVLVSGHRPIKIPKNWLFQLSSGPWSDWSTVPVVSCPIVFMVQRTNLLLFPNKSSASVQCKRQTVRLTSASRPQRHLVLAEVAMYSAQSKYMMLFFL